MLDVETLGTSPGCIILSIGAVYFDKEQLGEEFYTVINKSSSIYYNMAEEPRTVLWWEKQNEAAREVLSQAVESKVTVQAALHNFSYFIRSLNFKDICIWGNGSDFDNVLLQAYYEALLEPTPWDSHKNNRCYRTLKSLFPGIPIIKQGVVHNALDDAKSQALHAITLLAQLNKGDIYA